MATEKILRVPPEMRDWWDEREARAMLGLDGKKNDEAWDHIRQHANLTEAGYFKWELYQVTMDNPVITRSEFSFFSFVKMMLKRLLR